MLGITFKENCPDTRNSKVADIYKELKQFGLEVDVHDPWANFEDIRQEHGIDLTDEIYRKSYDAVILAVAHRQFLNIDFGRLRKEKTIVFDTKSVIDRKWVDARL